MRTDSSSSVLGGLAELAVHMVEVKNRKQVNLIYEYYPCEIPSNLQNSPAPKRHSEASEFTF